MAACLTTQHDPGAVAAALLVCLGTSVLAALLPHGQGRLRSIIAGVAMGCGAWATHFIAISAYDSGLPSAFDVWVTLLSALLVIVSSCLAFVVWTHGNWVGGSFGRLVRAMGGAILGLGIGAMHYLGTTSIEMPGHLDFAPGYVAASLVLGAALGSLALLLLRPDSPPARRWPVALLLSLSVVVLHFTGMAALEILPDSTVSISPGAMSRTWIAALVACTGVVIIAAAMSLLGLEAWRDSRVRGEETHRLRQMADAAFEAVALFEPGGRLVEANHRLAELLGRPPRELRGIGLAELFDGEMPGNGRLGTLANGVPVEANARRIDTASGPRLVLSLRDVRAKIEAERQILYLAHHDTLTGLGNRALLLQSLAEAEVRHRRDGDGFALLLLDLDRFKPVNDMYGHAAGDELLRQVAARLRETVRETDLVVRLGGDEFVVMQFRGAQPESAETLARRIAAVLAEPFHLAETEARISASIGIALFPQDAADGAALLRAADVALYRVKEGGRQGHAFFRAGMSEELISRRAMEQDIRLAVPRGELWLAWQPQADALSRGVVGFEALLRWTSARHGSVAPAVFVPVAEACGAMAAIGEWVLAQACREAARWANPLRVAVNVSPVQVQQPDFPARVAAILRETGLDPARLELEVTESLLIREPERVLDTLRRIKAMGVGVALDDFGTGYSSLGTLHTFPFDKVKVDRSFVQGLTLDRQSAAIVNAILNLSRGLGLPVVAEGVETEAQLEALRAGRCEEAQGYLFGRPEPITAYAAITGGAERPLPRLPTGELVG